MNVRRILISVAPMCLLALAAGCSSDNVRATVHVWEINEGLPVNSDVYNFGVDGIASTDDYIVEDQVEVVVWSQARDGIVNTDVAYRQTIVESYEVIYESEEEIEGFSGGLGWLVPVRNTFTGYITVVPASVKTSPPISSLAYGGEIMATARIIFHAREVDSNNTLSFETRIPVHFANWADSTN